MKQTAIRIPDDIRAAGQARAAALGRSFGNYVRLLITEDLRAASTTTPQRRTRKRPASRP
ncbi:MAG: hypothetical protein FGM22_08370 [Burkholderiaceae bacterium]|nr:hypothetical protein [Burkholderiaceae bacterium]